MKRTLPVVAALVLAGCAAHQTPTVATTPGQPTVTVTPTTVTVTAAPIPVAAPVPAPVAPAPAPPAIGPCADGDLSVVSGTMQSADTQRHVALSFINVSSHPCTLFGYPGADLVTPAGGVLINVPRRPAPAAHRLVLAPNDVARADVATSAIDTATGNDCPRWGALVVTPPNDFQSRALPIDLPICNASISTVD
jgi:hypothetical protein